MRTSNVTDHRKDNERAVTIGFIVCYFEPLTATSRAMLAIAVSSMEERRVVLENAVARTDITAVKALMALPDLRERDELTIVGRDYAAQWFESKSKAPESEAPTEPEMPAIPFCACAQDLAGHFKREIGCITEHVIEE